MTISGTLLGSASYRNLPAEGLTIRQGGGTASAGGNSVEFAGSEYLD